MLRVVLVVMWASCVFPPPVESIKVLYVQACQGSDSTVLVSSTVSHNYSDAFLVLLNCSACRCDPPYTYRILTSVPEESEQVVFIAREGTNVLSWTVPYAAERFGGSYRASVGPGYPQVFYFEFPGNTTGIRLGLESESKTCAFISVQNTSRDELEDASFFLVLIGANSSLCHTQKSDIETWAVKGVYESKYVNITVYPLRSASEFIPAILAPIWVCLATLVVTLLVFCNCMPKWLGNHCSSGNQLPDSKLRIPSMSKCNFYQLDSQYNVYAWNTITVGIFYALPAFQLVISQQLVDTSGAWGVFVASYLLFALLSHQSLRTDGNGDQCYYNFKCAVPYGVLRFDLLGIAMVMEGLMSGFYHICPSGANFQFDTAFMFIIGGLLLAKIFQNRHPDFHANAFIAFFCFAVVIFFTFLGIYFDSKNTLATRIALLAIVMGIVIVYFVSMYYFHQWQYITAVLVPDHIHYAIFTTRLVS
eukprot:Em0644g2a